MSVTIQWRRDLAANWTSVNPVLNQGEGGLETDTGRAKMGDGVTGWTALPYWDPAQVTAALAAETARAEAAEAAITVPSLPLAITSGGTGATSASAAVTALGLGTAATQPSTAFDAAGSAATAQSAAQTFASSAVATETSRAQTAEGLLAPKASPVLTGTPAAPTASPLTSTTVIATTAYADLATGAEKTRAQAAEALLAPKASPALTGTPTAPTAATSDATTQVATDAFVHNVVTAQGLGTAATQPSSAFDASGSASAAQAAAIAAALPTLAAVTVSASGALALGKITVVTAASGALTMTLPASAANSLVVVERAAASTANVAVTGNIRGVAASTVTLSLASESEMFFADGATWWPVAGHKTLASLTALFDASGAAATAQTAAQSFATSADGAAAALALQKSASLSDVASASSALGNIGGAGKPQGTDLVLYVSKNGNDSSDGLSWGTAKLTIAASFAALPNGGVLNAGAGTWHESGLVPPSYLIMHGAGCGGSGARTILMTGASSVTGDLFAVPASWLTCSFDGIIFESNVLSGGHVFNASTSSMSGIVFTNCALYQLNDAKCIWYMTDGTAINCTWRNCWSQHTPTSTIPSWQMISSIGGLQSNNWEDHWHTYSGDYVIHIESISASSFSEGDVFRNFTWEQCTGGFIRLLGVRYSELDNLIAYDNSGAYQTITRDGYYLGKGTAGNLSCFGIDLKNVVRLGGTLATRADTNLCGTTLNSAVVTDTAAVATDLGRPISGPGIPAGSVITSVTSGGGVGYTISAVATATAAALSVTFTVTTAVDIRCFSAARTKISACSGVIDLNSQDVLTENQGLVIGGTTVINRSPTQSMDITPISGVMLSPGYSATGMAGATVPSRYVGAFTSLPPSGTFLTGDWGPVPSTGGIGVCTAGGTPGTWAAIAPGSGLALDSTAADITAAGTQAAGATGKAADAGHVHPAPSQLWAPADNGWLLANGIYDTASTVITLIAGTLYLFKLKITGPVTIGHLVFQVNTGGTGTPTGCYAGLFSSAGTLLTGSSDVSANFTNPGWTNPALTTPQALSAGTFVWAGLLLNFPTAMPHLNGYALLPSVLTSNTSAAGFRFAVNGTGITAPASMNNGSNITPASNTATGALSVFCGAY